MAYMRHSAHALLCFYGRSVLVKKVPVLALGSPRIDAWVSALLLPHA